MSFKRRARHLLKIAYWYLAPRKAVRHLIRLNTPYEPELDLLPELVDPLREAIDVGANLGIFTERLTPIAMHVLAIEAHPRLARVLKRTFGTSASVYQAAVSDRRGDVLLQVPVVDGGPAEGLSSLNVSPCGSEFRSITISAMMLDDFADRNVGFVKIDVEGHEQHVLDGAHVLIQRQRPVFLIEAEERHRPGSLTTITRFFTSRNYEGIFVYGREVLSIRDFKPEMQDPSKIPDRAQRHEGLYANNFIFIPGESELAILFPKPWPRGRNGKSLSGCRHRVGRSGAVGVVGTDAQTRRGANAGDVSVDRSNCDERQDQQVDCA